jgi:hypothetical protein
MLPFRFWIESIRMSLSFISGKVKTEAIGPSVDQKVIEINAQRCAQSPILVPRQNSEDGHGMPLGAAAHFRKSVASSFSGAERGALALDVWVRSETAGQLESSKIGQLVTRLKEQDVTLPLMMTMSDAELKEAAGSLGTYIALRRAVERARLSSVTTHSPSSAFPSKPMSIFFSS